MCKRRIATALASLLLLPGAVMAEATIYGSLHVSVEYFNHALVDDDSDQTDGINVSSNESRLGFKGYEDLGDGLDFIWQVESQVELDGGSKDLVLRNSYAGISGNFGKVIAGRYEMPFYAALTEWDPFNTTVGEGRALFGEYGSLADAENYDYNLRADNVLLYSTPNLGGARLLLAYSSGSNDGEAGDKNQDQVLSPGIQYESAGFRFWAAYQSQERENEEGASRGVRVSGIYGAGPFEVGLLWESLDHVDLGTREGYGVHMSYKLGGGNTVRGNYYLVDEWENAPDSAAAMGSVMFENSLSPHTQVYVMWSGLDDDRGADYALGARGHGDVLAPYEPGVNPQAVSVGLKHKF